MKHILYLLGCLLGGSGVLAQTASHVVISEIYGGGGNSGATFTNDFIELYNPTSSAVTLTGWSVQYASSAGNFTQRTNLSGTIPANGFYLIQQAAGTGGTTALPTPDATGSIAMSGTSGKVALVSDTTLIGSNCSATTIVDLVGFGAAANCSETSPTGTLGSTSSAERKASASSTAATLGSGGSEEFAGNGYDGGNNSSDFVVQSAINPQNSSMAEGGASATTISVRVDRQAAEPATVGRFIVSVGAPAPAGGISLSYTLSGTATAATDYRDSSFGAITIAAGQLRDTLYFPVIDDVASEGTETIIISLSAAPTGFSLGTSTATMNLTDNEVFVTRISAIQGTGTTAIAGTYTAEAIVTGVYPDLSPAGFYIQEEASDTDANAASSEAIFVVSGATVSVGDKVQVSGTVAENGSAPSFNQAVFTTGSVVNVISSSNALPTPVLLRLPVASMTDLERLEGMMVRFADTLTVTNNYGLDRYGELGLSAGGLVYQPTQVVDVNDTPASGTSSTGTGNIAAVSRLTQANALRTIIFDDGMNTTLKIPYINPADSTLRLGTRVAGLSGILGYAFSQYRIQPQVSTTPVFMYAPRPALPGVGAADLRIAGFNVLNYFNGNGNGGGFPTARGAHSKAEFDRQRAKIIAALSQLNADIVGLIELENDGTGPTSAIQDLVNGLNGVLGAGTYTFVNDGSTIQTGGSDAIRCGIIYKPAVVAPSGTAMLDAAAVHNRPPLAQAFVHSASGKKLVYVINHFKSKGCGSAAGADQDQADGQSCYNDTRRMQTAALLSFISNTVIPASGTDLVLSMGDYNAYFEEDPMDMLRTAGYQTLSSATSYSYQFSGQVGSLDHAVASDSLTKYVTGVAKWNINAAEPVYLDYNDAVNDGSGDFANNFAKYYNPGPYRSSDHDPVLVGVSLQPKPGVSVGQAPSERAARIVPNPARGFALVDAAAPLASVSVYAADGRLIGVQQGAGKATLSLDLNTWAPGMYLLRLVYANGKTEQTRLTVTNW